jgi:DNA gyrase/topoisomerase IV subunit A
MGKHISNIIKLDSDEKIVSAIPVTSFDDKLDITIATKNGMIKRTLLNEYIIQKGTYQAVKFKEDDELIKVEFNEDDTTIMFVTSQGMGLNAEKSDIPLQGRVSGGVKGVMLADGDYVVSVDQVKHGQSVVILTNTAYAKQINTSELDVLARYRKGVKVCDLKGDKSTGNRIVCAGAFAEGDDVVIVSDDENYAAISTSNIPEDTRLGKGKCLSVDNKNISMAIIRKNNL